MSEGHFPFPLWYIPIGVTHGNETLIAERIAYISGKFLDWWLPSMWFGFFLAIFSFLAFFILTWSHKRHTKQLLTLAALTLFYQFTHYIREILKASPIPWLNEVLFWTEPNKFLCSIFYLWHTWVESSEYVLSAGIFILLAASVSATRKDGQYLFASNSHLFKKILRTLFWYPIFFTAFIAFFVVFFSEFVKKIGSCGPDSPTPSILAISENFLWVAIDAYIIGASATHFYRAFKATGCCRSSSSEVSEHNRGFGKLYRLLWFLAFIQLFARFGYNSWFFAVALNVQPGNVENGLWWFSTLGIWFTYFLTPPVLVLIGFAARKHHYSEDNSSSSKNQESEMLLAVASE